MTSSKRLILINVVVFFVLLVGAEQVARYLEPRLRLATISLNLNLQPYVMFSSGAGTGFKWRDIIGDREIPSELVLNNHGYATDFDYRLSPDADYLDAHGKKEAERIVLITGGSVVHGVGATSNATTIAAQTERALNDAQTEHRYRVINLGMGSWIAYQQFIGLSIYGTPFEPDWVIVMDGHNDAAVPCAHGSGPANPLGWPALLYMTGGGTGSQTSSPLMQSLASGSALVRLVTGISPNSKNTSLNSVYFDHDDRDKRFLLKMRNNTIRDLDEHVDFYMHAQKNVARLFGQANIILSSQPLMINHGQWQNYRRAFSFSVSSDVQRTSEQALRAQVDGFLDSRGDVKCGPQVSSETLAYFMSRSALELKDWTDEVKTDVNGRQIFYFNTAAALPMQEDLRKPHFIDNAHLTDAGQRRIGEFFASIILSKDVGTRLDLQAFAEKSEVRASEEFNIPRSVTLEQQLMRLNSTEPDIERAIYNVNATYGLNCGSPEGNATAHVAQACVGQSQCAFTVNVRELGDPAGGCGKDFVVGWKCSGSSKERESSLPPEAGLPSQTIELSCE